MPNLYGDILSDVAAQIAGSVGLAGSANVGDQIAMFEAIHGSAPLIAGKNKANPSGLLYGAIMMLVHIGQTQTAEIVHNASLRTIEEGVHTPDIFKEGVSRRCLGTREFAKAVVNRLGSRPETLAPVSYAKDQNVAPSNYAPIGETRLPHKETVGVDVFLEWRDGSPDNLGALLRKANGEGLELLMITIRGVKVFPGGMPETFCTDHWRCRFMSNGAVEKSQIVNLLNRINDLGFDFIKLETLCTFNGEPDYSLGQGQ